MCVCVCVCGGGHPGRVAHARGRLREEWLSVMLGVWLAFDGMLRPGELDSLNSAFSRRLRPQGVSDSW